MKNNDLDARKKQKHCRQFRKKSENIPARKAAGVFFGGYAAVLHALNGMDKDLLLVAKDDELGRKLQDLELQTRKRAPRRC